MNDIIKQYAKGTGAVATLYLRNKPGYGDIWAVRYGWLDEDGVIHPTGLPVLVYIRDGEVIEIPRKIKVTQN